jgi:hypothetical protein
MEGRTQHFEIGAASLEHLDNVGWHRATSEMHLALMRHQNMIGRFTQGEEHREQMSFHAKTAGSLKHGYKAERTGDLEGSPSLKPGVGKYGRN